MLGESSLSILAKLFFHGIKDSEICFESKQQVNLKWNAFDWDFVQTHMHEIYCITAYEALILLCESFPEMVTTCFCISEECKLPSNTGCLLFCFQFWCDSFFRVFSPTLEQWQSEKSRNHKNTYNRSVQPVHDAQDEPSCKQQKFVTPSSSEIRGIKVYNDPQIAPSQDNASKKESRTAVQDPDKRLVFVRWFYSLARLIRGKDFLFRSLLYQCIACMLVIFRVTHRIPSMDTVCSTPTAQRLKLSRHAISIWERHVLHQSNFRILQRTFLFQPLRPSGSLLWDLFRHLLNVFRPSRSLPPSVSDSLIHNGERRAPNDEVISHLHEKALKRNFAYGTGFVERVFITMLTHRSDGSMNSCASACQGELIDASFLFQNTESVIKE